MLPSRGDQRVGPRAASAGPSGRNPSPARLSRDEREEVRAGLARGETYTAIAGTIGRAVSTVSREVGANGGRDGYKAWHAHQEAGQRARRPKAPKLAHAPLAAAVTEWLEQWWSPEQIANRLRLEFPDDPMMRVSHETIYQSLFVEGRGELRRELHRCLRTGRARRRPRSRIETAEILSRGCDRRRAPAQSSRAHDEGAAALIAVPHCQQVAALAEELAKRGEGHHSGLGQHVRRFLRGHGTVAMNDVTAKRVCL